MNTRWLRIGFFSALGIGIVACSARQDLGADAPGSAAAGSDPNKPGVTPGSDPNGSTPSGTPHQPDAGSARDGSLADGGVGGHGTFDASASMNIPASCAGALGLQAGSPWPMNGRCLAHQGRTAGNGPATLPTVAWSSGAATGVEGQASIAADGTVYAVTLEGTLWAIHSNGTPISSYKLPSTEYFGSPTPTIAKDGTILIGWGEAFVALHPNLTLAWQVNLPMNEWASDAVVDDAGVTYFNSSDGFLHAVKADGTDAWPPFPLTKQSIIIAAPALGADGVLYVSDGDSLRAINTMGQLGWSAPLPGEAFTPVVGIDGRIYVVTTSDGVVHAFDANGTEAWSVTIPSGCRTETPAVGADGTIYIGGGDGQIHAITPAGAAKWTTPIADQPRSGVAVGGNGTIYVTTSASVVALSATGTQLWSFPMPKAHSLSITAAGLLLVGSDQLRALGD